MKILNTTTMCVLGWWFGLLTVTTIYVGVRDIFTDQDGLLMQLLATAIVAYFMASMTRICFKKALSRMDESVSESVANGESIEIAEVAHDGHRLKIECVIFGAVGGVLLQIGHELMLGQDTHYFGIGVIIVAAIMLLFSIVRLDRFMDVIYMQKYEEEIAND